MRHVQELLGLLADGRAPIEATEVTVTPIATAGMLTETVEQAPPPPGAAYVARARGRQLLIDSDEMTALRDAGAAFDPDAD